MRNLSCFAPAGELSIPVYVVTKSALPSWLEGQPSERASFVRAAGFNADAGKVLPLPDRDGKLGSYIAGAAADDPLWTGSLPSALPEGVYRLEGLGTDLDRAALGWALGAYQYTAYKAPKRAPARLALAGGSPSRETIVAAEAAYLARDLVNAPAGDLGPAEIEEAARELARRHDADVASLVGDDLLRKGFGLIHAVGRASAREPRLIDISWGSSSAPKLTLVGKGVVFDSGGLDIKASNAMLLMKKDMGGAANALGLAHMIMSAGLNVRLRVLLPAVENAISGNAYHPSDVLKSYKGLTVEIGNTDAEGRLVLADAMALADEEAPELMIDLATLTGAARVALGPELPAMYCDNDKMASELVAAGSFEGDPLWRMPLWKPYAKWLDSSVADINNSHSNGFAGSIVGALFLKRFVEKAKIWVHIDLYSWNQSGNGARAIGGEAQTIRALFKVLKERYS